MPLSAENKTFLNNNISYINSSFDTYKTIRPYMGVFITNISKPYITFSTENNFGVNIKVGHKTFNHVCTYVSADDFSTQTSAFLV
jgi:hypothetical protein